MHGSDNTTHTTLVTGGAGFIGSNLVRRLLEQGDRVIVIDNLTSGRVENLAPLMSEESPLRERLTFIAADTRDEESFEGMDAVDRIFNLACPASPNFYQADPFGTMLTNVMGSRNVLELARRNDARILQTSTSEIYGDPLEHPQRESYHGNVNPIGPRACYDEGKRAAEALFFDYWRTCHVDIRVVRIFNVYGPLMRPDDGRVVSNFIRQALRGEPITVYGDGSQTRSFCFVDDMVDALIAMMGCEDFNGPVNLGNPEEFTMLELARKVLEKIDSPSRIEFRELPADDPVQRRPDISLAREKLGWAPTIKLEEGLGKTIEYFRSTLG